MKYLLFFICLSFFIFSCKEDLDLTERSEKKCRESIEFTCMELLGDFFFSGKINGQEFCVSHDIGGYFMRNVIWTETVTSASNPELAPGSTPQSTLFGFDFFPPILDNSNGILQELSPFILLYTPSILDTNILEAKEYFDRFIKEGDLVLRDENTDKFAGFYFCIGWVCVVEPGYEYYKEKSPTRIPSVEHRITPSTGRQDNAVFRISELVKTETPDFFIYDITFEISCDLYNGTDSNDTKFYGRLEDGIFKTQVVLPKDG